IGSMGVDQNASVVKHAANGLESVLMRADTGHNTIARLELWLELAEVELTFLLQLTPKICNPLCITAYQIEHKSLKIGGARNVHGGAGSCVRLGGGTWPVHAGSEEL